MCVIRRRLSKHKYINTYWNIIVVIKQKKSTTQPPPLSNDAIGVILIDVFTH